MCSLSLRLAADGACPPRAPCVRAGGRDPGVTQHPLVIPNAGSVGRVGVPLSAMLSMKWVLLGCPLVLLSMKWVLLGCPLVLLSMKWVLLSVKWVLLGCPLVLLSVKCC